METVMSVRTSVRRSAEDLRAGVSGVTRPGIEDGHTQSGARRAAARQPSIDFFQEPSPSGGILPEQGRASGMGAAQGPGLGFSVISGHGSAFSPAHRSRGQAYADQQVLHRRRLSAGDLEGLAHGRVQGPDVDGHDGRALSGMH